MDHRRRLTGRAMDLLSRYLPTAAARLRRRQLWKRFKFSPAKQLLFDASGKLRPLRPIIEDLAKGFSQTDSLRLYPSSKFIEPDLTLSVNIEIMRRLGRLSPINVIESDQGSNSAFPTMHAYHLAISQNLIFDQDDGRVDHDSTLFISMGNLAPGHSISQLTFNLSDALHTLLQPNHLQEIRLWHMLEHWHRSMQHLLDGTASVDCIAGLALETNGCSEPLVSDPAGHNITALEEAENTRRSHNMIDGGHAFRIYYPGTPGIAIKAGEQETYGAVHFHPQVETTGILAMKKPIVILSATNYTLIEMTMPESLVTQYEGQPLSALIDHPLLNRLNLIIDSIDTRPPITPLAPTNLERQVLTLLVKYFLYGQESQPQLDRWFEMPLMMTDATRPMIMVHHRPATAKLISKEDAMRFQLP